MNITTVRFMFSYIVLLMCVTGKVQALTLEVDHNIQVELNPKQQTLQVTDVIQVPVPGNYEFTLYSGLEPRIIEPGVKLTKADEFNGEVKLTAYRVELPATQTLFTLKYGGKIAQSLKTRIESPGRRQQLLSGAISEQGVFLDGGTAWYPRFENALITFKMQVTLPSSWMAVSQGAGPDTRMSGAFLISSWQEKHPQDDIYLIAAPYHFYSNQGKSVEAQVYLRQQDPKLAQRYLKVTEYYLELYNQLIGAYPYDKFALVENFWETGYGMPSFTLLGSRVIRLPFILHSSYPHEILHNWWGNGVYVDYSNGNWSEGLTSYLADHLIKEQSGKGIEYRRSALQRFADFVRSDNDFALQAFRSRHSGSTQAVGYSKSMMLFHMLRRKLGDEQFINGLRQFYRQQQFKKASFDDLRQVFETVSGYNLKPFFNQWLQRKGAPALSLENTRIDKTDKGYSLSGRLRQTQSSEPYRLDIPMLIYMQDNSESKQVTLSMDSRMQNFSFEFTSQPLRLEIDPWFDIFRQVHATEVPSSLSGLFGSERVVFVLPSKAPPALLNGYKKMVQKWSAGYEKASVVLDNDLDSLPEDSAVWLFGWENKFRVSLFRSLDIQIVGKSRLENKVMDDKSHSVVLTHVDGNERLKIGWVGSRNEKSLAGLTRKLPHYGKYSYLLFEGDAPTNVVKGQWDVSTSPLKLWLSEPSSDLQPLEPSPLWP